VFALRKTLRYRLTLAFLMWTAGIQLAIAGVFVVGRELFVVDSIDRALADAAVRLRHTLEADPSWPPSLDQASFELQTDPTAPLIPVIMRVRTVDGKTLVRWPDREPPIPPEGISPPISPDAPYKLVFTTMRVQAQSDEDDTIVPVRFRAASMTINPVEGGTYELDFGASLQLADRFTSVMSRILGAGLIVGIVGAGIAGWIVAGRASRRIERITSEVAHVSPTRLDEPRELPTGEDEIGRMGEAVNAMLHRLASAFRSQEYFISNVSHELKTPIASLLAEAQVLQKGGAKSLDGGDEPAGGRTGEADPQPAAPPVANSDRLLAFTHSVEEEMRRLGSLVETFLAMARFGEGRGGRAEHPVSMFDTALDSVKHTSLFARQQGVNVRLKFAEPSGPHADPHDAHHEPIVRGDGHLLRVAIDNLLRNAIGVSQRGDAVDITVSTVDHTVGIEVADHGPGVPADFVDRMFDRFAQRPDRAVGHRGTGLGLNIAKTIVDLHGGRIEVSNAKDHGAVFTIRLPLAARADSGTRADSSPDADATPIA
jgi:signal transduction histidine kinase